MVSEDVDSRQVCESISEPETAGDDGDRTPCELTEGTSADRKQRWLGPAIVAGLLLAAGAGFAAAHLDTLRSYAWYGLHKIDPAAWYRLGAGTLIVIACLLLSARLPGALRLVARCVLLVVVLRLVWLYNPLAWEFYERTLPQGLIGYRHNDEVRRMAECSRRKDPIRYLAVGSSQTEAVYAATAHRRKDLKTFTLSGAGTMELLLYQDMIVSRGPETVLLFLSEFDLARRPTFATLPSSPYQGLRAVRLWRMTAAACPKDVPHNEFFRLLAGDLVAEYKYSFVFKGLLGKYAGRLEAMPDANRAKVPEGGMLQANLKSLEKMLSDEYVNLNCEYLEGFLKRLDEEGIPCVIVEGNYHPRGYSENNLALHAEVHDKLLAITERFANVRFVPRRETPPMVEADFSDGYHLTREASLRFADWVLRRVESETSSPKVATALRRTTAAGSQTAASIGVPESQGLKD